MSVERQSEAAISEPPVYFSSIKERASKRWDQLEGDPELAGPWHLLFKQVQSPRHILSELLQNADDAGATKARVSINDNRFVFEHNGEDFVEAHFESICRFGYSNKRALHTIGFRGIGFKSTFSLGDRVELFTPTLCVAFESNRFTEPHWISGRCATQGVTRIEVTIANSLLCREVEKNLDEWLNSPVSLLFFKGIRRLQVGEQVVHWQSLGPGPVAESEWMSLDDTGKEAFLLARSGEEAFPADALDEIRKERMLGAEEDGDFPPCRVEIVMGAKGRLYVVLPTGVETPLPFASNAPFIQDPARLKIKDPETSPTNRWLLQRVGELAAKAMLEWLQHSKTGALDRAAAYGLLPDVDREASTLEGSCAAIVELAFADAIKDRQILLTDEGNLVGTDAAIVFPLPIFDIWPAEQAMALLDEKSRPALCRHVSAADRIKLVHWNLVEEFSKSDLLARLRTSHLPRPSTWRHLLNLWTYIAPEVTGWQSHQPDRLRIVPVQGKDVLCSASEVVRLGEKKLLQSDDDWEFLAGHLIVLNQNWTRFLAEQRRDKGDGADRADLTQAAFAVLKKIGLDDTSDVNAVIERVAVDFFKADGIKLVECVQLAQIAAKLNATVGDSFRYVCANLNLRPINMAVVYDEDGTLEDLLPDTVKQTELLHPDYVTNFSSCSREDWLNWVSSGRSGLQTFAPLTAKQKSIHGRQQIEAEAKKRGLQEALYYHYVTHSFIVEDYDFPTEYWRHWEALSKSDREIWTKIAQRVLKQRDRYWSRASRARLLQVATTGSKKSLTSGLMLADWVLKLSAKPCLPDTRDAIHVPADLLRRTPETEPLIDVEPFVHGLLDREKTQPLLDLLGVHSSPSGPTRLLDRLRALAQSDKAPIHEVEKWYRRIDQMLNTASTSDTQMIKDAFRAEKLILAQDGTWVSSRGVFLTGDEEDIPSVSVIRASVIDLSLWRRIGVPDQPSADLAIEWLGTLTSDEALSTNDARRVRALLARYPTRIWDECRHWVNLSSEWVKTDALSYRLSMQSLFAYGHLHDWVKRKTADFRQLSAETVCDSPFSSLQALSKIVEERLNQPPRLPDLEDRRPWLTEFGSQLARIELTDTAEAERVPAVAAAILATTWVAAPKLEVIPYIEGIPAGTARITDILWLDGKLFVSPLSKAKLAKRVPEEIGKGMSADIRAALAYAFERSPADIKDYFEENFTLSPEKMMEAPFAEGQPATSAIVGKATDKPDEKQRETALQSHDAATVGEREFPQEEIAGQSQPKALLNEQEDGSQESVPNVRTDVPRESLLPSVIARFALGLGYTADGPDRFYHSNGSWITRTNNTRFPWQLRKANGEVQRYYFPKEHYHEQEPLQVEADVWSLLDQQPDTYAFILVNPDGIPVEVTGTRLQALRNDTGAVGGHAFQAGDQSASEAHSVRSSTPTKPQRPDLIVRFALAHGFKADGQDRFYHSDGSWIARTNGARFPWERRTKSGQLERYYFPKEHCLERDPLQVEADVWSLLDNKPDSYSFILINPEGEPVEMTGASFRALRDDGAITIHPATYRLVYDLEK